MTEKSLKKRGLRQLQNVSDRNMKQAADNVTEDSK